VSGSAGRIARHYKNDKKRLGTFHIYFYALNKDGVHGAASLWRNGYEENNRLLTRCTTGASRVGCVQAFLREVVAINEQEVSAAEKVRKLRIRNFLAG